MGVGGRGGAAEAAGGWEGGDKGMGENQRGISRREEGSEKWQAEDGFLYLGLDWLRQDSRGEQRAAGGQAVLTAMRNGGSAPYKPTQIHANSEPDHPADFCARCCFEKVRRR